MRVYGQPSKIRTAKVYPGHSQLQQHMYEVDPTCVPPRGSIWEHAYCFFISLTRIPTQLEKNWIAMHIW